MWLLLVAVASLAAVAAEDAYVKHDLVPDVIDKAPPATLEVVQWHD